MPKHYVYFITVYMYVQEASRIWERKISEIRRYMYMYKQLYPPNVAVYTDTSVCGIRLHVCKCTCMHMHELVASWAMSVSGMDRNYKSTLYMYI